MSYMKIAVINSTRLKKEIYAVIPQSGKFTFVALK